MSTNNLPATHGENTAPAVSLRNTKPGTRRNGTRNASRRALADIGNRTISTNNNHKNRTNATKSNLLRDSKKSNNAEFNDSIATRTRGKRRRAANAIDENTRNTPRQRVERVIRAPEDTIIFHSQPTKEELEYAKSLELPEGVIDIDSCDSGNHLNESTLTIAIMKSTSVRELSTCASPGYMFIQNEVTSHHRKILIDWLVDVHSQFRLSKVSLYLTVNIVDRFLSKKIVSKRTLQLVGVGCMLIASKYEEIYPPSMDDFVYIADGSFTRDELIRMEALILNILEFRVTVSTALPFLTRSLKAAAFQDPDPRIMLLANYSVELALCDYDSLHYRPSLLAAAAVLFASRGAVPWDDTMAFHSGGYTADMLSDCVDYLRNLVADDADAMSTRLNAVRRKYSKEKYGQIALVADELKNEIHLEDNHHHNQRF